MSADQGTKPKPPGNPEAHVELAAWERDKSSPVWDMSQERVFIETLLNQRFNFFLVFFSLVLAGAVNAKESMHFKLILSLGATVTFAFAAVLRRSQEKLDLILDDLKTDETHPIRIIDKRAKGRSMRRVIGIWIPTFCVSVLVLAAILAWINVLHPASVLR